MRTLRVIASSALLVLLLISQTGRSLSPVQTPPPASAIDVKVVKYAGLCDLVEQNKGKVVLLDFWSTTCKPCKESFFHTVEMYNKYRDKGLAVISVSTFQLDEDNKEDIIKPAVLQYLRSQNATFTNVILDELPEVVKEKLRIVGIPSLYVFNRQGQWTQFKTEDLKPDASHRHVNVEQYVQYLLEKKQLSATDSHKTAAPLERALGRIPSGLFVLTARQGVAELGMLASWVQQCSFEPPQISVGLRPGRDMAAWLTLGAGFTLNILDDGQTDMIVHFGKGFKAGEPAFDGLDIDRLDESGPVLRESLAFLECRVVARFSAGDHDLVVGRVVRGEMLGEGHPMVHIRKSGMHY